MSQHNYVLADADGATFRADLNAALLADQTMNSGATAPSTMIANMLWLDTASGLIKQRNSTNTAWLTWFKIDLTSNEIELKSLPAGTDALTVRNVSADSVIKLRVGPSSGGRVIIKNAAGTETLVLDGENDRIQINGTSLPIKPWTSSEQAVPATGVVQIAHGLGVSPFFWSAALRCNTAEQSYVAGDEVMYFSNITDEGSGTSQDAFGVIVDATNITIAYNREIRLPNKSTGNQFKITEANWRWVARALTT